MSKNFGFIRKTINGATSCKLVGHTWNVSYRISSQWCGVTIIFQLTLANTQQHNEATQNHREDKRRLLSLLFLAVGAARPFASTHMHNNNTL